MPDSSLVRRSPHASKHRSFLIGLTQMFLMAINIRNMANGHLVFVTGFTLVNTWVWVYLVRTVVHSTKAEVAWYAGGAAIGADAGVIFGYYVIKPLAFTNLALVFGATAI